MTSWVLSPSLPIFLYLKPSTWRQTIPFLDVMFDFLDLNTIIVRASMKSFLNIAAKESYFFFDEKLFQQGYGVAMGSSLVPTIASMFLSCHAKKWPSGCPVKFKLVLHRRYLMMLPYCFQSSNHINSFLDYLNSKHPNLRFSRDIESNSKLSFLDIKFTARPRFVLTRTVNLLTLDSILPSLATSRRSTSTT